jgi:hypothetical protein
MGKRVARALIFGGCVVAYALVAGIIGITVYDDDPTPAPWKYVLDYPAICIFSPMVPFLGRDASELQLIVGLALLVPFWGIVFESLIYLRNSIKRRRQPGKRAEPDNV